MYFPHNLKKKNKNNNNNPCLLRGEATWVCPGLLGNQWTNSAQELKYSRLFNSLVFRENAVATILKPNQRTVHLHHLTSALWCSHIILIPLVTDFAQSLETWLKEVMKVLPSCRSHSQNLSLETDKNTIPADVGGVKYWDCTGIKEGVI